MSSENSEIPAAAAAAPEVSAMPPAAVVVAAPESTPVASVDTAVVTSVVAEVKVPSTEADIAADTPHEAAASPQAMPAPLPRVDVGTVLGTFNVAFQQGEGPGVVDYSPPPYLFPELLPFGAAPSVFDAIDFDTSRWIAVGIDEDEDDLQDDDEHLRVKKEPKMEGAVGRRTATKSAFLGRQDSMQQSLPDTAALLRTLSCSDVADALNMDCKPTGGNAAGGKNARGGKSGGKGGKHGGKNAANRSSTASPAPTGADLLGVLSDGGLFGDGTATILGATPAALVDEVRLLARDLGADAATTNAMLTQRFLAALSMQRIREVRDTKAAAASLALLSAPPATSTATDMAGDPSGPPNDDEEDAAGTASTGPLLGADLSADAVARLGLGHPSIDPWDATKNAEDTPCIAMDDAAVEEKAELYTTLAKLTAGRPWREMSSVGCQTDLVTPAGINATAPSILPDASTTTLSVPIPAPVDPLSSDAISAADHFFDLSRSDDADEDAAAAQSSQEGDNEPHKKDTNTVRIALRDDGPTFFGRETTPGLPQPWTVGLGAFTLDPQERRCLSTRHFIIRPFVKAADIDAATVNQESTNADEDAAAGAEKAPTTEESDPAFHVWSYGRNGVKVNGRWAVGSAPLEMRVGDTLQVGTTDLKMTLRHK